MLFRIHTSYFLGHAIHLSTCVSSAFFSPRAAILLFNFPMQFYIVIFNCMTFWYTLLFVSKNTVLNVIIQEHDSTLLPA